MKAQRMTKTPSRNPPRTQRAASRAPSLATECVDKARRQLLGNPRTAATLNAIEVSDLRTVAVRSAAAIEQLLAVARGRRRILAAHKAASAVPVGVQRYHSLLLDDALASVRAALPEMHRLAVRLEVSGLNSDFSRFVIGQMLTAPAAGTRLHTLPQRFARDEPKALLQLLKQSGLSAAALDDLQILTQPADRPISVDVLAPGDRDYPGATGGGAAGGGGSAGSTAVGAALGGLHIPKGLSGLIEGAIEQVRGILDSALQQDWTYGFAMADGAPTMRVDFGPRPKDLGPTPGGQLGAVGGALSEIGGWLFLIGLAVGGPFASLGMALYLIGLLLRAIGLAWDALSSGQCDTTGFVDP